ncbi:MAG: hypothetical protein ACLFWL_14285 [Candidatus Brocadiia bacterium]
MTPERQIREISLTKNAFERGHQMGQRLRDTLRIPVQTIATNIGHGGKLTSRLPATETETTLEKPVHPKPSNYRGTALAKAQKRLNGTSKYLVEKVPAIQLEDVKGILSNHEIPVCTGNHDDPDGAPWDTICSSICRPAENLLSVAPGLPCRHAYQPFRVKRDD